MHLNTNMHIRMRIDMQNHTGMPLTNARVSDCCASSYAHDSPCTLTQTHCGFITDTAVVNSLRYKGTSVHLWSKSQGFFFIGHISRVAKLMV